MATLGLADLVNAPNDFFVNRNGISSPPSSAYSTHEWLPRRQEPREFLNSCLAIRRITLVIGDRRSG